MPDLDRRQVAIVKHAAPPIKGVGARGLSEMDHERIIRPLDHTVGDPRHLVPWGTGEEITDWQSLQSKCEGRQVSGCYYLLNELPRGWEGVGFELTTNEVMVAIAAPVMERAYRARLLIRWLDLQQIWTPSMRKRHTMGEGRASHLMCDVCKQVRPERCPIHQVQGEVIRGFRSSQEPTPNGGDTWLFEFNSGLTMRLEADPVPPACAELDIQITRRGARS